MNNLFDVTKLFLTKEKLNANKNGQHANNLKVLIYFYYVMKCIH